MRTINDLNTIDPLCALGEKVERETPLTKAEEISLDRMIFERVSHESTLELLKLAKKCADMKRTQEMYDHLIGTRVVFVGEACSTTTPVYNWDGFNIHMF